jgi:hypothetical protein
MTIDATEKPSSDVRRFKNIIDVKYFRTERGPYYIRGSC